MAEIDKIIGIRLKIARKSCGYKTAVEFYNAKKIPKSTYSQHEIGERNITAELILKYAALLEVNPAWLLTGVGHPCPNSKNGETRREFIEKEIQKLKEKNIIPEDYHKQIQIKDRYANINLNLFLEIIKSTIKSIISQGKPKHLDVDDLVTFCIDVYNNIEVLNETQKNKEKLIEFSIKSILKHAK